MINNNDIPILFYVLRVYKENTMMNLDNFSVEFLIATIQVEEVYGIP